MKQKGVLINALQQPLIGYVSGAGVISANDNPLSAIEKLNGNINILSSGPYYLRGNSTTLNSVRIAIIGGNVNLEEYNGTTWDLISLLGSGV